MPTIVFIALPFIGATVLAVAACILAGRADDELTESEETGS